MGTWRILVFASVYEWWFINNSDTLCVLVVVVALWTLFAFRLHVSSLFSTLHLNLLFVFIIHYLRKFNSPNSSESTGLWFGTINKSLFCTREINLEINTTYDEIISMLIDFLICASTVISTYHFNLEISGSFPESWKIVKERGAPKHPLSKA